MLCTDGCCSIVYVVVVSFLPQDPSQGLYGIAPLIQSSEKTGKTTKQYMLLVIKCILITIVYRLHVYSICFATLYHTHTGRKWTAVCDLSLEKVKETVLIRTRVHNRRGAGGCELILHA